MKSALFDLALILGFVVAVWLANGCRLFSEPDTVKHAKACTWVTDTLRTVTPTRDTVISVITHQVCPP